MTPGLKGDQDQFKLFVPNTTTLVEIIIDREPLPAGDAFVRLCKFINLNL